MNNNQDLAIHDGINERDERRLLMASMDVWLRSQDPREVMRMAAMHQMRRRGYSEGLAAYKPDYIRDLRLAGVIGAALVAIPWALISFVF